MSGMRVALSRFSTMNMLQRVDPLSKSPNTQAPSTGWPYHVERCLNWNSARKAIDTFIGQFEKKPGQIMMIAEVLMQVTDEEHRWRNHYADDGIAALMIESRRDSINAAIPSKLKRSSWPGWSLFIYSVVFDFSKFWFVNLHHNRLAIFVKSA